MHGGNNILIFFSFSEKPIFLFQSTNEKGLPFSFNVQDEQKDNVMKTFILVSIKYSEQFVNLCTVFHGI